MAESADISKAAAEKALNGMLAAVTEALSEGDKVTLVGFGTFSTVKRSKRTAKNPRTGEMIKIPANVTFKIGIIDAWGNQNYVQFPAYQEAYGLVRNGEWAQASIPVSEIRGLAMDLRMLSYSFVILEESGTGCEFALDDIYWDAGVVSAIDDPIITAGRPIKLAPNVPNPFNAMTTISFDLPTGGTYNVEIFDIAGRRIIGFHGVGAAGLNTLHWNGRDEAGKNVSSGTFFYRLEAGSYSETRKMIMVK